MAASPTDRPLLQLSESESGDNLTTVLYVHIAVLGAFHRKRHVRGCRAGELCPAKLKSSSVDDFLHVVATETVPLFEHLEFEFLLEYDVFVSCKRGRTRVRKPPELFRGPIDRISKWLL